MIRLEILEIFSNLYDSMVLQTQHSCTTKRLFSWGFLFVFILVFLLFFFKPGMREALFQSCVDVETNKMEPCRFPVCMSVRDKGF